MASVDTGSASLAEPGQTDPKRLVYRPPAIVASWLGLFALRANVNTDIGVVVIATGYCFSAKIAFQIGVGDITDNKDDRNYEK